MTMINHIIKKINGKNSYQKAVKTRVIEDAHLTGDKVELLGRMKLFLGM